MSHRAGRRPAVAALLLLPLLLMTVAPAQATQQVEEDAEGLMLSLVNDRRASHGRAPLAMANDLRDDAREHARRQLSTGSVHHDPDGSSDICCYRSWGENVTGWSGEGPLDSRDVRRVTRHLHDALFDSDDHRQNLLSGTFTEVGIGIAADRSSGDVYVTQVFREPADPSTYDGRFADDEDSAFEAQINALAEAGIATSCDGGGSRFCPSGSVTRGEMAAFLRRARDLPPTSRDHFTDDTTSVFEDDIDAIAEAGISDGCNPPTNDRFCPGQVVPRGQMATFLSRAFDLSWPGPVVTSGWRPPRRIRGHRRHARECRRRA